MVNKKLIYARVATQDQVLSDSLNLQLATCLKYCHGADSVALVWRIGKSQEDFSKLKELLEACADDGIGEIVVTDTTRLSRDAETLIKFILLAKELGITLTSLSNQTQTAPIERAAVNRRLKKVVTKPKKTEKKSSLKHLK
ncbi:MAG: recombinase family protein [Candidatus Pacebacteria bacterium]|nr:recombinase family protein [Candidatus Paceibacterota bacterium]